MTHLYLIRHGAYSFSEQPPYDLGLSEEGVQQANRLCERLAGGEIPADVLVMSPAPRARQTASIIAAGLSMPAMVVDEEIFEWCNLAEGALEPDVFIEQLYALPADEQPFFNPGTGCESWSQFAVRACNALYRISQTYRDKHIVIVCHAGIIEASFLLCFGLSPMQPWPVMMMVNPAYVSITHWHKIVRNGDFIGWRLEQYNDAAHLR